MPSLVHEIVSPDFMPHGHCYLWRPAMVWLQVLSNGAIGLSYLAISASLAVLVYRVRDIPFKAMYAAFGIFIVTCGVTHFFDVVVIWSPLYWIDGAIRAVTAIASVGTAAFLPPLVPKAVTIARGAKAAHDKGFRLETMVKELETMVEKTKELDALKTQFFASVSHELRTPLALILGPAERLATATNLDDEQRRSVDVIARNARTLLRHVNDLLDVAKLEARRLQPRFTAVDVAERVRVAASHFEALAQERGTELTVDAAGPLVAEVDPDQIDRVLLNVLSNAFKFTPAGGRVRCSVAREGGDVVIAIADSGPGVPPSMREAVFERFRQLEGGSTRRFGGTGLGLAIARELVALHEGTIAIDTAPEGGALVRVRLPMRAARPSAAEAPRDDAAAPRDAELDRARQAVEELRVAAAPEEAPAGDRPTVLVVEDNRDMNRFVCETLHDRYRATCAFDGAEGLSRALASPPDLIVSDVMMPEMSGDALVAAIRRERALDGVPVLLVTAKADDDLRVRLLRDGAQDYVMKPFAAEELRARVDNLVAMKRARDVLQRALDVQTRDVSTLAEEIAAKTRALSQALEDARRARELAQRASEAKRNMITLLSHELRTPLTAIELQLDRLRAAAADSALADAQRRTLVRVDVAARRLGDLVESLLTFAITGSDRLPRRVEPIDARALAEETVDGLRAHAEKRGLDVIVDAPAALPPLVSDARMLRIALSNLVDNAIKFTDAGQVVVRVAFDGAAHRLSVADTGRGISAEDRERIFEPFEHAEPINRKHTPGFGLGLPIVQHVVRALGGTLEWASEPGRGSRFTVVVPASAAEARAEP